MAVATLSKEHSQGWILDLRGNFGGNMWPMVAGVGALEEKGSLGAFVDDEGKKDVWFYAEDGAGADAKDGQRQILCWVPKQLVTFQSQQIVAVLIDGSTGSSGEALAIAFQGQALCRSFGRHTHGGFPLSDGAGLVTTDGVDEDRTRRPYFGGIQPDEELPLETEKARSENSDPYVAAAAHWIANIANQKRKAHARYAHLMR